jgi:membrane-associated protein
MFDLESLIESIGLIGVAAIIFAENGLLIGFFLPGDSLLFTAGIFAARGFFNPWVLLVVLFVAATAGVSVGYAFGFRWGRKLFDRPNSRFFKQENLRHAENFYEKYGGKTIILARFVPIVRTFGPIIAGIGKMSYPKFLTYNIIGGAGWVGLLIGAGYWLGTKISNIDRYLLPIIVLIVFLSAMPGLLEMLKTPERRKSLWSWARRKLRV